MKALRYTLWWLFKFIVLDTLVLIVGALFLPVFFLLWVGDAIYADYQRVKLR